MHQSPSRRRFASPVLYSTLFYLLSACADDAPLGPSTLSGALSLSAALQDATTPTLSVGQSMQLADPFAADGEQTQAGERTLTWESRAPEILTVDVGGVATGRSVGQATVIATLCRNGRYTRLGRRERFCSQEDIGVRVIDEPGDPEEPEIPDDDDEEGPDDEEESDTTSIPIDSTLTPVDSTLPPLDSLNLTPQQLKGMEAVRFLLGPLLPVTAAEGLGPTARTYEQQFRKWAEYHWTVEGARWDVANYYDRAAIYYVWWARTGNATYYDRANRLAVNYRDNYLVANGYNNSSFWSMLTGVALHYLVTGDAASRRAVGYAAEAMSNDLYFRIIGKHTDGIENRTRARVLMASVLAHVVDAPQGGPMSLQVLVFGGRAMTWKVRAKAALDRILAAQGADGSWKDESNCYYAQPFMDALLMDAMTVYHRVVEADPRIVTAVKKTADYMWSKNWLGPSKGFIYIEGTCVFKPTGEVSNPGPTPPLTLMFPAFYAWLSKVTGDPKYMGWADIMFADGVPTATYEYGKQFNQAFESSFRYVGFKLGAP